MIEGSGILALPNKSARGTQETRRKPRLVVASLSVAVALQQPMRAKNGGMKIIKRETYHTARYTSEKLVLYNYILLVALLITDFQCGDTV